MLVGVAQELAVKARNASVMEAQIDETSAGYAHPGIHPNGRRTVVDLDPECGFGGLPRCQLPRRMRPWVNRVVARGKTRPA